MRKYYWSTVTLLAVSCSGAFCQATQHESGSPIRVGKNVLVNRDRVDEPHYEVLLDGDRRDAKRLLGCSMLVPKEPGTRMFDSVAYFSDDGGYSWKESLHVAESWQVSDPTCAFGEGGAAYMAVLVPGMERDARRMLFRSADYGATWEKPLGLPFIDREYLTVDHSTSQYHGRIYLHGTGHVDLIATEPDHVVEGMGNGVALSDGTFIAVTGELLDHAYVTLRVAARTSVCRSRNPRATSQGPRQSRQQKS